MAPSPATNLPLITSSRWIGWATRRGRVRCERSPLTRVETEGDAEQRSEDREELVEGGHAVGRQGEQVEEDRGHVGGLAGGVADRTAGRVHRGQPGERDQHDQDDEADRVDVVGELLAGDDAPAAGQPVGTRLVALARSSARVSGVDSMVAVISAPGEVAVVDRVEVGAASHEVIDRASARRRQPRSGRRARRGWR